MYNQIKELFNTDIKSSEIARVSGVSRQLIGRYRTGDAGINSMTLEKANMILSAIRYKVTDNKGIEVLFRDYDKANDFKELLFQSEKEGLYTAMIEIVLK